MHQVGYLVYISSDKLALIADAVDSLALIFQDINCNSENVQDPDKIYTSNFVVALISKLIVMISPDHPTNIRLPSFDCLTNLLVHDIN